MARFFRRALLGALGVGFSLGLSGVVNPPAPARADPTFQIYLYWQPNNVNVTNTYANGYVTNPNNQVLHVNCNTPGHVYDDAQTLVGYYTGLPPE